ncbi:DUF5941 domain-containing protein [Mangrovihabitans endophyticus]|uniref:DUF5941 domain-containing protein n=1 Tax=Mangrovihabitans endophyticus TaxID=1751298 RepID=A0A8J3FQ63_9ACTN|nr:DUF5941 domain-containing protein [Mangrovihabitans endophyticus]GGK98401.1 hypothetical protein GCM10012284_35780 [Mangrovihabitans endophyticus]
MSLAVLCASTGNALDRTDAAGLADDLTAALRAAGATTVERDRGDGDTAALMSDVARRARETGESLLICADNLVAHPSLVRTLATEPSGRTAALVVADPDGGLREDRGLLVSGSAGAGARFAGALCVAPGDLAVLERMPAAAPGPPDTPDAVLAALLDAGVSPVASRVRLLHAERVHAPGELAAARAVVATVDEDAARLRLAVKEKDDFFTTYAVSSWSPHVTKWCARWGLSPSQVTVVSIGFAVAAAAAFWQASRPAMILGAILLYLGFVLDCVDGQLARYSRRFDAFGGWLDTMADRAKEYAVYAGLAAGAERIGLPYAWPLAITAMLLQTVRHMTDAWYGALHDEAATRAKPATAAAGGVGARLTAASNRVQSDSGSAAYWLKRIVVFPIGERWALLAVLAALFDGRVALAAVVVCGLLAAAYTLALRSLRSMSMRVGVLHTVDTARHRDDGLATRRLTSRARLPRPLLLSAFAAVAALALVVALLAGALEHGEAWGIWISGDVTVPLVLPGVAGWPLLVVGLLTLAAGLSAGVRHDGPLDWLVPAALRAAEYLLVVAVALVAAVPPPVTFLLLFTLALRHYDVTARMEKSAPAADGRGSVFGWEGRVVVLLIFAMLGLATPGELLMAVLVGGAFLHAAVAAHRAGPVRPAGATAALSGAGGR